MSFSRAALGAMDPDEAAERVQVWWRQHLAKSRATAAGFSGAAKGASAGADFDGTMAALMGATPGLGLTGEPETAEEQRQRLLARAQTLLQDRERVVAQNLSLQRDIARLLTERRSNNTAAQAAGGPGSGIGGGQGAAALLFPGLGAGNSSGGATAAAVNTLLSGEILATIVPSGGISGGGLASAANGTNEMDGRYWDAVTRVRAERGTLNRRRELMVAELGTAQARHEPVSEELRTQEHIFRNTVKVYALSVLQGLTAASAAGDQAAAASAVLGYTAAGGMPTQPFAKHASGSRGATTASAASGYPSTLGASADAYAADSTGANAVAYLEQQEDFLQNLTQQLLADPNAPQFGGSKKPASSSTAVAKTYAAPVTKGLVRRQLERLDEFCAIEDHAGEEIARARVDYTQLRNRAQRLQQQLKVKEQLHEGVHLIDFEQLKIENTNLNEKIEERNEDLLKLRKKATTTIHILTHVKEKLEFIKSENGQLEKQSKSVEQTLTATRDRLGATKRDRDVFVHENARMKEKTPLIGADDLLMDYELRKKAIEQLRVDVVTLTNRHHELMLWIRENHGELSELQRRQMEL